MTTWTIQIVGNADLEIRCGALSTDLRRESRLLKLQENCTRLVVSIHGILRNAMIWR
jgi:hypothetical protein